MSAVASAETLRVLDFPLLVDSIAGQTQTVMGRERLLAVTPTTDRDELEDRHRLAAESRAWIASNGPLSLGGAEPLGEHLRQVTVAGTVLETASLLAVARTAKVASAVRRRLAGKSEVPGLAAIAAGIPDLSPLVSQIGDVLDDEGEIKDDASPELVGLRRKKKKLKSRLLDSLEKLVRSDKLDGVLRDRIVTERSGRYVVPVHASRRGALQGVVHDSSSSGQTIYVEPLESVEAQNALVEAEKSEDQEIQRLLAELTAHVSAAADALAAAERAIEEIDALQGIARFAEMADAVMPEFVDDELALDGARHPLMIESGSVVPLDLALGDEASILVITGPNTGGKTVALKTVALLTLMAQCGIPVPAARARLRCCPRVHADIGDDQSIIANLSTFSAHLTRIQRFLEDCPPGSLVLLDELGTGTDPAEGAALGVALLERLDELGALTLASTHHDALKAFAHGHPRALNAAMEFDGETLQPTFRLRLGLPGRSNAFDIAARLGLERKLVERARGLLDVDTRQLDSLLRSVEGEAESLASDREDVQQQQDRLMAAEARLEGINRDFEELRQEFAHEGRKAVEEALGEVRGAGERLLDELAEELGETRRSRAAQDRRARWAARVSAADASAQSRIAETVDAAVEEASARSSAAGEERAACAVAGDEAGDRVDEMVPAADDDPAASLRRGDPVLVMPMRLRGRVGRDWDPESDEPDDVEVDVHGKRLIVGRQQVRRLEN